MRVCQVGTGFTSIPPKGSAATELIVYNISKNLVNFGHEVDIIDVKDSSRENNIGAKFYEVSMPKFMGADVYISANKLKHILKRFYFSLKAFILLYKTSKTRNYDVIHFHNQFTGLACIFISKLARIPTVFTVNSPIWTRPISEIGLMSKLLMIIEIIVIKNTDMVIAVSKTMRNNLIKMFKIHESKIVVIPNGVDANLFTNNVSFKLKEKIAPNGELIVLNVARISRVKNQKSIIEAASKVVLKCPKIKFVFAGPVDDEKYLSEIQKLIIDKNLENYVEFIGNIPPFILPKYYSIADVFILTSIVEGLPLALLEAMCCGKAIIVSALPTNMDVLKTGNEVLSVNPINIDEIANSIIRILTDKSLKKKLENAARETALELFNWEKITKNTEILYKNLCHKYGN